MADRRAAPCLLGKVPAAGVGQDYQAPVADHETVLRLSPFGRIVVTRAEHTVRYTTEELAGLQFTYAHSSPVLLGDQAAEFAEVVSAALLAVEPSGVFEAAVTASLITGRACPGPLSGSVPPARHGARRALG